jgi:hypothetical protein
MTEFDLGQRGEIKYDVLRVAPIDIFLPRFERL